MLDIMPNTTSQEHPLNRYRNEKYNLAFLVQISISPHLLASANPTKQSSNESQDTCKPYRISVEQFASRLHYRMIITQIFPSSTPSIDS